ncbi:MAG TPA: penicillin-binding protein 2 [Propionibacteriaceae bacterium]
MAEQRRPHPSQPGAGHRRVLRTERPHPASRTARPSEQHARGERILRDGTRVAPRPRADRIPPVRRPPRREVRMPLASSPRRLHVVLIVVAMGLSLCGGRLLQLQGFDSAAYAASSADALTRTLPLLPARGELTDRNGLVLASTQPAVAVTADPTLITDLKVNPTGVDEVAAVLSGYLQMPTTELIPLLTKPKTHFVYLKKKVPALTYSALAADLSKRKMYGIFRESDPIRSYPNGSVGAAVVGYVGADGKGQGGLELTLNTELAGVEGKETYESAPNGSKIPLGQSSLTPATNGLDYQLTIDSELQWAAERRVAEQVAKTGSDWGFAIVMDVKTGEILAMANAPTLDSSKPGETDAKNRGNRAISDPYEPGSVEKVITAAALLDAGVATPDTRILVPNRLRSDGISIKDAFGHAEIKLLLRGVVAKSSNIGTAVATRQLTKQKLHDYLRSFGLGAATGIELPGEAAGIIPPADMTNGRRDQVAFGQAISVTGIQEAAAIAGIVNGGIYNPPTVLKKSTDSTGADVPLDRQAPRRIVSEKASDQVRDLMQAVIDSPNGQKNLKLDAYQTGGKTGTAQRADTTCGCYKGYVTSFVGVAPIDDPQILTYVVMSDPKRGDTGSGTAAPVYRDIMNQALPRYSVPPNTKAHKPLPIEW